MPEEKQRNKPGPKPKTPRDLTLKLNDKQRYWLDFLVDKGFHGNTAEEAAMRLLDKMFEKLYEEKALPDAFIEPVRTDPLSQELNKELGNSASPKL